MMKRIHFLGVAICALPGLGLAQDVLYLNDQSRVEGTLTDLSRERVSVLVNKGSSGVRFTFGADRVLLVVNRRGRFVCLDQLWFMPTDKRTRLVEQFMAGKEALSHDMLIRDNPVQVLYGKITAASGSGLTYLPLNGPPTHVPKANLIGVFYKSGKHELLTTDTATIGPIATATPESGTSSNAMLTLSDSDYEQYRLQALERVEEFGTMLGVVADKTVESGQKDKAISEILKMFKPDATIQVSSTTPGRPPATLRMQDYLRRLKLLPYTSVSIEWTDVQFVQELTQRDDGNYYGKIRGEQLYSGLNQKTGLQYSDVTEKDVDVLLTPYKKQTEGQNQRKWAVLLGNVGVVTTN